MSHVKLSAPPATKGAQWKVVETEAFPWFHFWEPWLVPIFGTWLGPKSGTYLGAHFWTKIWSRTVRDKILVQELEPDLVPRMGTTCSSTSMQSHIQACNRATNHASEFTASISWSIQWLKPHCIRQRINTEGKNYGGGACQSRGERPWSVGD